MRSPGHLAPANHLEHTVQNLETITGRPADNFATARCFGPSGRSNYNARQHEGHGVTWKHVAGASIRNLKCPVHNGPLYQTTRSWNNNEWIVIPAATIKALGTAKRDEKKAALQKKLDAGTHKLIRDVQPGDIIVGAGKARVPSGKVVEVEKVGSKFRVTVSRTRDAVAGGYLYHGTYTAEQVEERADQLERLTDTAELTASTVVIVDTNLHTWHAWGPNGGRGRWGAKRVAEGEEYVFTGWAVEHAGAALAELWENEVKRWETHLADKAYTRPVVQGRFETPERYAERVAEEATKAAAAKREAEGRLQVAIERLQRHTGSARTSA